MSQQQQQGPRVYIITNRDPDDNARQLSDDARYDHIRTQTDLSIPPYVLYRNNGGYNELFDDQVLDTAHRESALRRLFGKTLPTDAILFVHGFNNSISEAQQYANQILAATQKNVIVYSWPCSHDNWRPASSYAIDCEMAVTSIATLNWVLDLLLNNSIKLDIMAHSMGSRIVVGSISNIAHDYRLLEQDRNHPCYERYSRMITNIQTIVFIEPDIDVINMADFVAKELPTLNSTPRPAIQTYIYVHNDDKVLQCSQIIHDNRPRVGQLIGAQTLINRLTNQTNIPRKMIHLTIMNMSRMRLVCRHTPRWVYPSGNHTYFDQPLFRDSIIALLAGEYITMEWVDL